MDKEKIADPFEILADFATAPEAVPVEQLKLSLSQAGHDVPKFLESIRALVRTNLQREMKKGALESQKAQALDLKRIAVEIAEWPAEKVRTWFNDAVAGVFGPAIKGMAAACHRNKEGDDFSEVELRSLVADLLSTAESADTSNDQRKGLPGQSK